MEQKGCPDPYKTKCVDAVGGEWIYDHRRFGEMEEIAPMIVD